MQCSNRKLLIVFEGSAQRERTITDSFLITAILDVCGRPLFANPVTFNP